MTLKVTLVKHRSLATMMPHRHRIRWNIGLNMLTMGMTMLTGIRYFQFPGTAMLGDSGEKREVSS